ncbi:MAG: PQQ-binding-like beta-propeller repeat protein, partial [Planctomycetaceae bacterium]
MTSRPLCCPWLWLTCVLALVTHPVVAEDWPQWMGPHRDGRWNEPGLIEHFPEGKVPTVWRRELAGGYSGPAVAGGAVFVTDFLSSDPPPANHPGVRDLRRGQERVWCLAADTGDVRWQIERPCLCQMSYATGPRATPTVADGLVYCLGAAGFLQCLDVSDGTEVWSQDLTRYTGAPPWWGFSSHPLVEGELVLCLVGGPGSAVVAFDRKTGAERWRSGSASDPGYSSIQAGEQEGQRLLLAWDADHLRGLEPKQGTELWRFPLAPQFKMSIAMPQVHGDIVFAGGKGRVSAALRLVNGGRAIEPLWRATATSGLSTSNAPPVLDEGVIYGCDCDTGALMAVALDDGRRL